jgi:predicted Zn-dependent peptidase
MQQEDILRDELYRQGLEVIKDLKQKSMTNEEIESQMSNKLNNLFNQGQISERLNNELYNYFVMKINSQN